MSETELMNNGIGTRMYSPIIGDRPGIALSGTPTIKPILNTVQNMGGTWPLPPDTGGMMG